MRPTEALGVPAWRLLRGPAVLDLLAVGATIGQVAALADILEPVLLRRQSIGDVAAPAAMLVTLTLVRAALLGLREVAGQRAAVRVKSLLRVSLFARLMHLRPSTVQGERAGELVSLAGDGIERLDSYVSRYLPQSVLSVTGPALVVAYVFWLDQLSAGLLLLSAPVIPLLMVAVGSYT
ncbi:MAG TPA: ABC transporter transmembrane domain-containing protein, partial [Chloroflexota bacterium]|nr:ABC transporter transmembrane domain-containing protein [Chloroflexota bacterium]